MLRILFGVFVVLHGLVHLLYFGQSWRLFELQAGMVWPDGAWAFSKVIGDAIPRLLASISCILAAMGFVVGGAGILVKGDWWRPAVVVSAAFSSAIFILFWDGKTQRLDDQGGIGLLINVALLVGVLLLGWSDLGF
jgi:hypothetical protein